MSTGERQYRLDKTTRDVSEVDMKCFRFVIPEIRVCLFHLMLRRVRCLSQTDLESCSTLNDKHENRARFLSSASKEIL